MIRLTIKGKEETMRILERLPHRLVLALTRAMTDSAILIQSLTKANAPVFRGLLRVSILQSVTLEGNKIVGHVGSALRYAPVVEFGRESGWFPNVTELKIWARRKFGLKESDAGRMAFLVGRAIKRRGFAPQPYLHPAFETAGPRIPGLFALRISQTLEEEGGKP